MRPPATLGSRFFPPHVVRSSRACAAALILLAAALTSTADASWWSGFSAANAPDARVHTMLTIGDSLYCAGQFSSVAGAAAKVAVWNGASWSPAGTLAASSGIEKLATHGGQLVAVGNSISTGVPASMRVVIFNGSTWSQFGGAFTPSNATCAVEYGGSLVVGGSDGQIHRWTGSTWSVMGGYGNASALPRCLIVHGGSLYVGGDVGLRRWNGSAWLTLGSGLGGDATVFGMASRGDSLIVVGSFNSAGGTPVSNAAAWDGAAWHALGLGFNGPAYDVAETSSGLYASGSFSSAGGVAAAGVARWNGTEWSAMGAGVTGTGFSVAALGQHLYVGGNFTMAGGAPSHYVARWTQLVDCNGNGIHDELDISNGTSQDCNTNAIPDECDIANGAPDCNANGVPDGCEPDCDADGLPDACELVADCNENGINDDCDIASGLLTDCDDNGVADDCDPDCDGDGIPDACEPNESWTGLGTSGQPDQRVHTLQVVDSLLYCGGQFSGYLASWNGVAWDTAGLATNGQVERLVEWRGRLVALGNFTAIGGVGASRVAQRVGTAWSAIPNVPPPPYRAATAFGGDLIYGSDGTTLRWDGANWTTMGTGGATSFCNWNGTLFRGNNSGVDRWNGTAWLNVGTADNIVWGLAVFQSKLYAIGSFTAFAGQAMRGIAVWDSVSWSPIGSGLSLNGIGFSALVYQNRLYVGGTFTAVDGIPASGVIAFDGRDWRALGSGLSGDSGTGWSLANYDAALYVGGKFAQAGGVNSPMLARWSGCTDCNLNGIDDRTEIQSGAQSDLNGNGLPDSCDIASGSSGDCNGNGVPDEIEPDCDHDGIPNTCEPFGGGADCNANNVSDACDISSGASFDCNQNGVPDECEPDCDGDGVPDDCETLVDCNANQIHDTCDILSGASQDCDQNGVPDECQPDCDDDDVPDVCESPADCDADGVADQCEIAAGAPDCDANGVPDGCQRDSDHDGLIDACEILAGAPDCNGNGVPDESDVFPGSYVFTRTYYQTVGYERSHLAAGDFDKDGWVDLAYHDFDVKVLWNEGGTGWTIAPFTSGTGTRTHAVGDFNGDGNLDVAMAMGPGVLYRLGTGTRTFGAYGIKDFDLIPQEYGRSMLPLNVDGDGLTDLVWIRTGRGAVGVVRGAELTSAAPEPDYLQLPVTLESTIMRIAVRGATAGGPHDIIVQNDAFGDTASGFYALRAQGGGNYATPQHFNSPVPVYALGCGDLNGDGHEDVVMEGWSGSQLYLVTWLSDQFGGFLSPDTTHHGTGLPSFDLALADFDQDGNLDVALKGGPVVLGTGSGKFAPPAHTYPTTGAYGWMTVLDYDRDGWPDLADAMTFCAQYGNCGTTVLGVHRNDVVPAGISHDEGHDGVPDECQVTDVTASPNTPLLTRLIGPLANPTRAAAAIRFELSRPATVRLGIYDLAGRLVREWRLGHWPAGTHDIRWDGRVQTGEHARGGVYFVRMETGGKRESKKFVFTR
ncbi:MAG: VCBS repeat-containing protein [Candidatus Eisenbacteria bacterium]|nr:VCBS repeat-containing protein [Candidatus Eisenbacteria bacterium]